MQAAVIIPHNRPQPQLGMQPCPTALSNDSKDVRKEEIVMDLAVWNAGPAAKKTPANCGRICGRSYSPVISTVLKSLGYQSCGAKTYPNGPPPVLVVYVPPM